jgi:hypothetical protein
MRRPARRGRWLINVKKLGPLIAQPCADSPGGDRYMQPNLIGHNSRVARLRIEARFFNSLAKYSGVDGVCRSLEVEAETTVGDLIEMFKLPRKDVFLVLRNGRDITPGLYQGGSINESVSLADGDVIAFSGPVPYSYGYGAPVV